ncbi:Uncharacterised protein [Yersinia enterocolitica]|uniref:hypothetical protein n=1 Tax=Yersinia enterocolitica TaxID=630 RepID=UPI0005DABD36|nr:hypothetical protein [Yersinia enterocolitica]CNG77869.1 Uncharacterised protein [Yersinia enterocolitica]HDL7414295.1 hypothetical protein [Yersinia enterocolitica]HEI6957241.1 hypothetical protein [Yersinia enterocolitica]
MANAIDFKVQPTHLRFRKQHRAEYPIDFKLQQGGKRGYPGELTLVSDSGKRAQPTQQQVER